MSKICSNCGAENKEDSKYCSVCGFQLPEIFNEEINPVSVIKEKRKNPPLLNMIAFAVTFVVAFFATQYFFSPSMDSQLEKVAETLNSTLPVKVDDFMTLEHVSALKDKTLQYEYRLIQHTKAEVKLDTVKKYVFSAVLENIRTNPSMEVMRKEKVTFKYVYNDKNGVFVCDYIVKPDMYKKEE